VLLTRGISDIMLRRILYISILVTMMQFVLQDTIAQEPSLYEITRMPFNNDAFSNISPVVVKGGLIFCSNRRFSTLSDRTAFDGHRLYSIYLEKKDSSGWSKPVELKSERNSHFNIGPFCIAPDGKTVYFTSEIETGKQATNKNFINHLGIFIADLSGNELTSIRPFNYNNSAYDVGQPSISKDGKYLFFASDMPGGLGKSDLYYCEWINGNWDVPKNLGPKVNSPAAEIYPYMNASGKLYFTSDRPGGPGKLDIYYTSMYYGIWDDPVALPEPINSTSDDFAFVSEDNSESGYFSSNRRSNDAIYRFVSTVIRKASCDSLVENNYCYRFLEENAVKYDTLPFRYEWKFGDGTTAVGSTVDHCFSGPGRYIVQLDAVNLITKEVTANEKSDTLDLKDVEQPYISGPDNFSAGQQIMLNADSTNLPGWKIARYYWNFGDGTINVGKKVNKTFSRPGTYNVQLIVTNEPDTTGNIKEACVSKNIKVIRQP
jgi:hypothetical protein